LTLRRRVFLQLALVHLALAGVAAVAVRADPRWLLAVEVLFLVSLAATWRVVRLLGTPGDIATTGAELLRERDFGSRFRTVGEAEADRLVALFNEMSQRLRDERVRLEEQHLFLAALIAAAPAGILVFDYEERVAEVNPAAEALFGVPAAVLAGRRLDPAEGELPEPLGELATLAAGESRLLAAGGRRLKASRAEFFDQGHRRGFVVVEELTGELRATEKAAYDKLIRLMSHEVNNSVGAVGSLLDSFLGWAPQLAPADRADFERSTEVAVARLASLRDFVGGYAEVVRLPPPERRPCDLARLVRDVFTVMRGELGRRRIGWRWEPAEPAAPFVVELDENQLERVLINGVHNAAEAIGEDGENTVELGWAAAGDGGGGRRFLALRDTGAGLPPGARDRLFTPFFSTKTAGRGLGLTLMREILTQHGFDFSLTDRPRGGAELRIWM
jgi:nitrogen fixation/metabolism regulation signal transduction histidine kinase